MLKPQSFALSTWAVVLISVVVNFSIFYVMLYHFSRYYSPLS